MTQSAGKPDSGVRGRGLAFGVLVLLAAAAIAVLAGQRRTEVAAPAADGAAVGALEGAARPLPGGTLVLWRQDETPGPVRLQAEGVELALSERATEAGSAPVLQLRAADGATFEIFGALGFGRAAAQVGVGRIDPARPEPQVLFTSFSGGAHCCADTKLVVRDGRGWTAIDVAHQDGAWLDAFPKDLDGDGTVEFQLADDRFLYAFESYAGSWAPPLFRQVRDGQVKDVSAAPGLRGEYRAYAARLQPECQKGQNGACAAFAAAAARLGWLDAAWPLVLASYQRDSSWELPVACRVDDREAPCPEGAQVRFGTYPEALRWFLGKTGYLPRVYLAPLDATGPSFDCAAAVAEVLKLVCGVPELAAADRELAVRYERALALSPTPSNLRGAQQAFLATRDESPPDAFALLRLYQGRLEALAATGALQDGRR
jgi:hypothetical protein